VGQNYQLCVERGKGNSVRGRFPTVEVGTGHGVSGAHGLAGPGEEGGSSGRSGLARRPGLAGLKSEEKIFSE
jgi:hypothetical protein